MKTLILYDSVFGNTEKIAAAIRDGIGADARLMKIDGAADAATMDFDLLVVGAPTRGFRPTPALSAWLNGMPADGLRGKRAAAFDTRMVIAEVNNLILTVMAGIFGFAAEKIGAALKKKGALLCAPAEGFFVGGSEGPLKPGELERAAAWGRGLAQR